MKRMYQVDLRKDSQDVIEEGMDLILSWLENSGIVSFNPMNTIIGFVTELPVG